MKIGRGIISFLIGHFFIEVMKTQKSKLKNIPILNIFVDNNDTNETNNNDLYLIVILYSILATLF
tara:strand:+ start:1041 stop:1235 length:195 start_codon:yes stop_codon:yes gene_type:complete